MTSKEFTIQKIHELIAHFPTVRCKYEHHVLSDTHFVEIVPNSVYKLNSDYLKWEEEITFLFASEFPSESLCFISNDALVGINTIDFELKGSLYDIQYNSILPTRIASKSEHIDYKQRIPVNILIGHPSKALSYLNSLSINVYTDIELSNDTIMYLQFKENEEKNKSNLTGEYSYAWAA